MQVAISNIIKGKQANTLTAYQVEILQSGGLYSEMISQYVYPTLFQTTGDAKMDLLAVFSRGGLDRKFILCEKTFFDCSVLVANGNFDEYIVELFLVWTTGTGSIEYDPAYVHFTEMKAMQENKGLDPSFIVEPVGLPEEEQPVE